MFTGHELLDVDAFVDQLLVALVDDVVDLLEHLVQLLVHLVADVDEDGQHGQAHRLGDGHRRGAVDACVPVHKMKLPIATISTIGRSRK